MQAQINGIEVFYTTNGQGRPMLSLEVHLSRYRPSSQGSLRQSLMMPVFSDFGQLSCPCTSINMIQKWVRKWTRRPSIALEPLIKVWGCACLPSMS